MSGNEAGKGRTGPTQREGTVQSGFNCWNANNKIGVASSSTQHSSLGRRTDSRGVRELVDLSAEVVPDEVHPAVSLQQT